ncbi:MAG: hypothetical protein IT177_01610 [Acidobacteria bacterium]|nr:hypothetical protein [Acidobacteriota bacterium]
MDTENTGRIEGVEVVNTATPPSTETADVEAPTPSAQLPAVDPELWAAAKAAVTRLRGAGRLPNGRAAPGNALALKTGLRSKRLMDEPDIIAWHQAQVREITADLGGEDELTALKRGAVREAARVEVILAALGDNLLEQGTLTGKGKTRSATMVYLHTLDRFVRLVQLLGFERRARRLPSPAEWLAGRVDTAGQDNDGGSDGGE